MITVDRLGNVAGRPYVTYVNAEIDVLASTAVSLIKANVPVFSVPIHLFIMTARVVLLTQHYGIIS